MRIEYGNRIEPLRYPYLPFHLSFNDIQQEEHFLILHPIRASQIDTEASYNPSPQEKTLFYYFAGRSPIPHRANQISRQTHWKTTQEASQERLNILSYIYSPQFWT